MSMVRCDECERIIDSDDDPDCFNDIDEVHCESCRDNAAERAWSRQFEGEPPVTLDEQHQAAWHEHQKAHRR